jgi:hypothetical protein
MNTTQDTLAMLGIGGGPTAEAMLFDQFLKGTVGKVGRNEQLDPRSWALTNRLRKEKFGVDGPDEDLLKALSTIPGWNAETAALVSAALGKSITTATGLVAYDLQAPAKNLYPFYTPLRNKIPRVGGGTGIQTNWRQVNAIIGSGYDNMGYVPEGQRAGQMSYNTSNRSANYVTLGEEDQATYEAIAAGRMFEDIQARMVFRLLQKMMLKEEMMILSGNASIQLGTCGTVTTSASGSGATLPTATYYIRCVLLTNEGFQNVGPGIVGSQFNTVATASAFVQAITPAITVPTSKVISSAGGPVATFTLNGGSSIASAEVSQAVTLGQTLFASVPYKNGAAAYAWFVGTASGAETLQAVTCINSVAITAPLVSGTQAVTPFTTGTDYSANPNYACDGLLTTALNANNNAYVNAFATGTAGTGTVLTSSGRGSVNEIDTMLESMWINYQLSATTIYVHAQELRNITSKVLNGSSSPLLRYNSASDGDEYGLTASGTISYYYNPFAPPDAGYRIPVRIHPKVPPGTIICWAENLPVQYQSNEVPNVAEVKTRQDYYQIDWPLITRARQVGVYCEEVLAVYASFAMGVLTNVGNG